MEAIALIVRVITAIIKALSFCWIFLWISSTVLVVCSFLNNSTTILDYIRENRTFGGIVVDDLNITLLKSFPVVLPPVIIIVIIIFIEKAIYAYSPPAVEPKSSSAFGFIVKWFGSISAAIVSGIAVWALKRL